MAYLAVYVDNYKVAESRASWDADLDKISAALEDWARKEYGQLVKVHVTIN